jgi:hypothetical protein
VTQPRPFGSVFLAAATVIVCPLVSCFANAQTYYPNTQVRIGDLPPITAKSRDPGDVLAASLKILLRDKDVCCGKNSALEDDVQRADPKSLKDVATKLRGRHLLSDGRALLVTAEFVPATSLVGGTFIGTLNDKQPLLMEWNLHLYVVYGVVYSTAYSPEGGRTDSILKIFLVNPRYSDQRREVLFDRQTDDWGRYKVY